MMLNLGVLTRDGVGGKTLGAWQDTRLTHAWRCLSLVPQSPAAPNSFRSPRGRERDCSKGELRVGAELDVYQGGAPVSWIDLVRSL